MPFFEVGHELVEKYARRIHHAVNHDVTDESCKNDYPAPTAVRRLDRLLYHQGSLGHIESVKRCHTVRKSLSLDIKAFKYPTYFLFITASTLLPSCVDVLNVEGDVRENTPIGILVEVIPILLHITESLFHLTCSYDEVL